MTWTRCIHSDIAGDIAYPTELHRKYWRDFAELPLELVRFDADGYDESMYVTTRRGKRCLK